MLTRRWFSATCVICSLAGFIATYASAQGAPPPAATSTTKLMSATDFMLDWEQYKGKRVTVAGCAFMMAGTSLIYCYANPKKNLTSAFAIDGSTLPREDRKILLLSGCNPVIPGQSCIGDVTGIASEFSPVSRL